MTTPKDFNPRTPGGVRRGHPLCRFPRFQISIHAPGWGATYGRNRPKGGHQDFNPRTPGWGATKYVSDAAVITFQFQSTHPGWGATKINFRHLRQYSISIHAPRVGCDNRPTCIRWRDKHFNPRTPGGVRLLEQFELLRRVHISIHAPRVGCDGVRGVESCGNHISIHAPRVGCDTIMSQ